MSEKEKINKKWSVDQIRKFFEVYRKYNVLYNTKHPDYATGRAIKATQLEDLLKEVNLQICPDDQIDLPTLKKKIKSLTDLFKTELQKVVKSKSSGAERDQIYKLKLAWFSDAEYLTESCVTRSVSSNLDVESGCVSASDCSETTTSSPAGPAIKKKKTAVVTSDIQEEMEKIKKLENDLSKRDENDAFGEYVAAQLKSLTPLEQAVLRRNITNMINDQIIHNLTGIDIGNTEI